MQNQLLQQKIFIKRLKALRSKACYLDVFRSIVRSKTPYTQNKNGIFFNISALSPELFAELSATLEKHEGKLKAITPTTLHEPVLGCFSQDEALPKH